MPFDSPDCWDRGTFRATPPAICSQRSIERFSQEGLTFGIHNHYFKQKFAYESPEDVLKALAGRSKTMGSTLDVGHIASCGYDTVDAVRKLAPYLKMVHLKDVRASGGEDNVLLGQGIAKIPASDGGAAQSFLSRIVRHRVREGRQRRLGRSARSGVRAETGMITRLVSGYSWQLLFPRWRNPRIPFWRLDRRRRTFRFPAWTARFTSSAITRPARYW